MLCLFLFVCFSLYNFCLCMWLLILCLILIMGFLCLSTCVSLSLSIYLLSFFFFSRFSREQINLFSFYQTLYIILFNQHLSFIPRFSLLFYFSFLKSNGPSPSIIFFSSFSLLPFSSQGLWPNRPIS